MIIDRWNLVTETPEEFVMLRTFNYCKYKSSVRILIPYVNSGSYETRSTTTIKDHHHLFYSDIRDLRVFLTKTKSNITWSSPLYSKVNYLFIQIGIILYSSLWNKLLNTVISRETTDDEAQQYVTYLSYLVDLSNITELEFSSQYRIYQWKSIQFILQACTNVTGIRISTRLLMLSKLIDNPLLIPKFKQIKMMKLIREKIYCTSNFASKFVQRFPSLVNIELHVFSFDNCVSIMNTFLTCLENLFYVKINYSQDTLFDDPFSCDYIIEKRRHSFPGNIIDEEKVIVKNNEDVIEIWLI
ncbi:unnamed protein product [Rotaria sp. Silwood2]|nr:unnamed protein product [Rotaria sp. Silwood2]